MLVGGIICMVPPLATAPKRSLILPVYHEQSYTLWPETAVKESTVSPRLVIMLSLFNSTAPRRIFSGALTNGTRVKKRLKKCLRRRSTPYTRMRYAASPMGSARYLCIICVCTANQGWSNRNRNAQYVILNPVLLYI